MLMLTYSGYTVVPPPVAQLYLSPKKDLSWTGLPECADDTVTDYSRPSPIVESSSEEDQNRNSSASENVASPITPKQFVKFVKASDSPTVDMGMKGKDVKSSACWSWKPSQYLSNKGPKNNSVSVVFKKYTYIDTQGRLKTKDETSSILRKFITEIENLKDLKVKIIRYDNRGEFRNKELNDFCSQKRIKREFSNARTPQQNGVAERRNRSLIEAAKTMVLVNKAYNKTPYELFNGRTPAIGFLKPFGCHVMILNTLDNLGTRNTDAPKSSGNSNPTVTSTNPLDDQLETLTVETPIPTASSPAPTFEDILGDTSNSEESNGMEAEEERIDYDEVFAPVARIEAIRLFLAYASFMGFTVYQMDVKSAFLYGTIDEEVYVMQPPGFQDLEYLARVYKVE
nr:hypothetical protein [Tanacetum cinerariifolium]